MSLYAVVPMLLAVPTGRFIDRAGVFRPLAWSGAAVAASDGRHRAAAMAPSGGTAVQDAKSDAAQHRVADLLRDPRLRPVCSSSAACSPPAGTSTPKR